MGLVFRQSHCLVVAFQYGDDPGRHVVAAMQMNSSLLLGLQSQVPVTSSQTGNMGTSYSTQIVSWRHFCSSVILGVQVHLRVLGSQKGEEPTRQVVVARHSDTTSFFDLQLHFLVPSSHTGTIGMSYSTQIVSRRHFCSSLLSGTHVHFLVSGS